MDEALAAEHSRKLQAPDIVGRLLSARGVKPDDAQLFLNPTLKDLFPDPSSFADMDKAAEVILDAIVSGKKVAVFADYDVDGGTSSAILSRYFRAWGRELILYVPDRLTEGYGPSEASLGRLAAQGKPSDPEARRRIVERVEGRPVEPRVVDIGFSIVEREST